MFDIAPLEQIRNDLAMPVQALWRRCLGLGGSLDLHQMTAYLAGEDVGASRMNHDVIVHALNEALIDCHRAPSLAYVVP
jgi:hypothetical protein